MDPEECTNIAQVHSDEKYNNEKRLFVGNLRNAISGRPLIRAFFSLFLPDECIFCLMNALPRHFWPISGIIRQPDRANWHAGQATHAGGP